MKYHGNGQLPKLNVAGSIPAARSKFQLSIPGRPFLAVASAAKLAGVNADQITLLEREEPKARLEAALGAARGGLGRVVSIEGEAGIGKTSLVLNFAEAQRNDARVHIGSCEHLATPEPLGPLRDIARESQGRFAMSITGQLAAFEALLRLLGSGRGPGLLVIEDIHWADDATLDLLRYLGRRIRAEPILVVVTFRNDEGDSRSRLASLWADMPRDHRERIELRPLSLDAVSTLAEGADCGARDVFEASGGNPFHVTEYLATPGVAVPSSVQEATLARAAALSPRGRRALDCAAIFPRQIDEATLRLLADDADHAGVEECLHVGMLSARGGTLSFRHELARRAVENAISPLRRRELHAAALAVLKDRDDGRAAEAAHHAEQAGAFEELVGYSVRAAQQAAALGAHRDALAHLTKALAHGAGMSDSERAGLLERQAELGEQCGTFDTALPAVEEAIAAHRRAGDLLRLGNALRISARLNWQLGQTSVAEQRAQEALDVMGGHADSWQYAMALSGQAQLDSLADRLELAIERGTDAMARAQRLSRWDIYLHALTNVSTARCGTDLDEGVAGLQLAIAEAQRLREPEILPRLYTNLTYVMTHARRYQGLFDRIREGLEIAVARDNAPIEAYIRGSRATALLDLGRAEEAIAEAELVAFGPYPQGVARFNALVTLSRAQVRIGLPDGGTLEQARALPSAQRDIMRLAPIAVADAEAHWLGHKRPGALERLRAVYDQLLLQRSQSWALADVALWLRILGDEVKIPAAVAARVFPVHLAHIDGDWRKAAQAWGEIGCPFEQAIALSGGDEADQREALAQFDRLGAVPAAQRLRRAMREAGARSVPSGPRTARRNDPAGLTPRQNQVLRLLAEGLSNTEIAERLQTSAKTAEHHVGAILAVFEAPSRLRAVQIARERGLIGD